MVNRKDAGEFIRGIVNPVWVSEREALPCSLPKRSADSGLSWSGYARITFVAAAVCAAFVGDVSTAFTLLLFLLLTRIFEAKAVARGRRSLRQFLEARYPFIDIAVEEGFQVPASFQTTADWLLGFLLCLSFATGLFTLLTTRDPKAALAVIIVGGPCGLVSGTFLVTLGALARTASHGLIIKSAASFEELARVDVMALDETVQSHLADGFCSNARRAIRTLNRMHIDTILLTSDLQPVGQAIGDKLGVTFVEAELFPEDKCCKIAALQSRARKVAMLSNGVEDRSALLQADVGVLIGPGMGLRDKSGDVIFLSESLYDFAEALAIVRRAQRTVTANLVLTALIASVGIGLGMGGLLSPIWAIAIRFTSELALVLNAARLLPPLREARQTK